jgi:PEGA domain
VGAAETRLAEAERARSAAEAAAAAALGAEVARVRGEAETRLQSELERIRREAEAARAAEQSVAKHATEQIREAAAREAREVAEQAARRTLDTEIARVRVQADTFLETEVSRVRSEAQDRQAAELQDLRAQMAEIRETAARTAAEKSGDYYKIWQPRLVPVEKPQPVVEVPEPATPVSFETYKPWLKWALPMAASVLLIANSGMVINTFASFVAPSPKKEPPPVHAVEPVEPPIVEKVGGALKIDSTPVGAEALIDGHSYGKTPLTIPDLRPGVHTLVLRTGAGSVTRRVTIKAGQTAISSEAIFAGWLAIFSPIPVEVSLNGRRAPVAENGRIMTAPGTYRVDLVNARFNYHVTETLDVRPGEVTAHTVSIPTAAVHVTAPDGADISVDGQPAGKAPLADLTIPIGTHAITATHPDRGARTTTLAVRFDEINNARLEFDR